MTDDEIIAVVQAHKEGKKIQGKVRKSSPFYTPHLEPYEWTNWPHLSEKEPHWDFGNADYRVAPEPRKPREYWLEIAKDGSVDSACREHEVRSIRGGELVLVREVIE